MSAENAAARLDLLLPWLNGDYDTEVPGARPEDAVTETDYKAVRAALAAFVRSFDGSPGAGHVEIAPYARPAFLKKQTPDATDEELGQLGTDLRVLLEQGFGPAVEGLSLPVQHLRVAVRSAARAKPKKRGSVVDGGVQALRAYRAAGAFVLRVSGPTTELVPYLVAHLLTQPDVVSLRRCEETHCYRLLVTAHAAKGRPQRYCSMACKTRAWEKRHQRRPR